MKDIELLKQTANACSEVMRLYRLDQHEQASALLRKVADQADEIVDEELRAKGEALVQKVRAHVENTSELLGSARPVRTLN